MTVSVVTSKQCTRCGAMKPLDEFHRNRTKPDGRVCWCKPCNSEAGRLSRVDRGLVVYGPSMVRPRRPELPVLCDSCYGAPNVSNLCDAHQMPLVCICDQPDPDGWGQCNQPGCKRPYEPRFAGLRAAWRDRLGNTRRLAEAVGL